MSGTGSESGWIEQRLGGRTPGRAGARVLAALRAQPREMSFASTAEAARLAGVNVATVVRTAQALGYPGWPALRSELRSRYLSRLSAAELLGEHAPGGTGDGRGGEPDGAAAATLHRDLANLRELAGLLDEAQITRVARLLADARSSLVLGSGSFAAPGLALAHQCTSLGRDVRLQQAGGTALVNAVGLLRPGDLLLVIQLWRTPHHIRRAATLAAELGARVVVLTDRTDDVTDLAGEVVLLPSEGSSMFPSLVAAMTVVQAVITALVAADPVAAGRAGDRSEEHWRRFGLFPEPGGG